MLGAVGLKLPKLGVEGSIAGELGFELICFEHVTVRREYAYRQMRIRRLRDRQIRANRHFHCAGRASSGCRNTPCCADFSAWGRAGTGATCRCRFRRSEWRPLALTSNAAHVLRENLPRVQISVWRQQDQRVVPSKRTAARQGRHRLCPKRFSFDTPPKGVEFVIVVSESNSGTSIPADSTVSQS